MSQEVRRVAVLFSRLSGYMAASLRALRERHGVELLVYRRPPVREAPFEERHFEWISQLYNRNEATPRQMLDTIERFRPDAVFMSGWMDKGYLKVAKALKQRNVPVVAGSDTQWVGSLRQQVGRIISPWYLSSAIDVLWVAGERQRQLAENLGFTGPRCWSGVYACEWDRFADIYRNAPTERTRAFLYVGRYVSVKGLDVLLDAYRMYRRRASNPWPLICAGAGPERGLLEGQEGVIERGFIQPDQLPALFAEASAFVLPSRKEPWGVVVQEAAAAGLPLICSEACGAAVHLLQDRYNGFLFETGNPRHLAQCLVDMAAVSPEVWSTMSRRSHALSMQYTPERWANTLVQGISSWRTMSN